MPAAGWNNNVGVTVLVIVTPFFTITTRYGQLDKAVRVGSCGSW